MHRREVGRAPIETKRNPDGTAQNVTLIFMSDGTVLWAPPPEDERPAYIYDLFPR